MADGHREKEDPTGVGTSPGVERAASSAPDSTDSTASAEDGKIVLDLLASEYKLLQDKVDKIGAFPFTVKGWSVTLVIVSTFAIGANRNVDPRLLLLLIIFVIATDVLLLPIAESGCGQPRRQQFAFGRPCNAPTIGPAR